MNITDEIVNRYTVYYTLYVGAPEALFLTEKAQRKLESELGGLVNWVRPSLKRGWLKEFMGMRVYVVESLPKGKVCMVGTVT